MVFADLPARHERSAPTFDDTHLEEIERYFLDLETLFNTHNVIADGERKQAAVRYIKAVRTEKLWRSTPAFADPTKTYDEFKVAIFRIYPGASEDRTYTTQDLDALVGERVRVGIYTPNELGDYFRQYLLITRYLISKNRMAVTEQSRTFLRGFRQDLSQRVMRRLELKKPDHMPQDPYDLDDIYDAANFVLMGSTLDQPHTKIGRASCRERVSP